MLPFPLSESDEEKLYQLLSRSAGALGEEQADKTAAAGSHLEAWRFACSLMDYHKTPGVEPLLRAVGLREPGEWALAVVMDLEAAMEADPNYYPELLNFCSEFVQRTDGTDGVLVYLLRMSRAQAHARQGNMLAAEMEYDALTRDVPQVPDGWVLWSELYIQQDDTLPKAAAILERARQVAGMEDRAAVLEPLMDLYELLEEFEKGEEIAAELDDLAARRVQEHSHHHHGHHHSHGEDCDCGHDHHQHGHDHGEGCACGHDHHGHVHGPDCDCGHDHHEPHVATDEPGRNAPCPCGSGKKYKKCCGA